MRIALEREISPEKSSSLLSPRKAGFYLWNLVTMVNVYVGAMSSTFRWYAETDSFIQQSRNCRPQQTSGRRWSDRSYEQALSLPNGPVTGTGINANQKRSVSVSTVRWCLERAKLKAFEAANGTLPQKKHKKKNIQGATTDNNSGGNQSARSALQPSTRFNYFGNKPHRYSLKRTQGMLELTEPTPTVKQKERVQ